MRSGSEKRERERVSATEEREGHEDFGYLCVCDDLAIVCVASSIAHPFRMSMVYVIFDARKTRMV